jgi:hypothetical protein
VGSSAFPPSAHTGRGMWRGGGRAAAMHGGRVTKHRTRGVHESVRLGGRVWAGYGLNWAMGLE